MKKIAVMQPYIFPYVGYFQLIKSVDVFVFYDDVNFIKQGWINRNKILANNAAQFFTIPISKTSSFQQIKDTKIHESLFYKWRKKFLKSLQQTYGKSPYFSDVFPLIQEILFFETLSISEFAIQSVIKVSNYLELKTEFCRSSVKFSDTKGLDRVERLVQICLVEEANVYVNNISGSELYKTKDFSPYNITLRFLNSEIVEYDQNTNEFIAYLSIIDLMMFNSKEEINVMLNKFTLQ